MAKRLFVGSLPYSATSVQLEEAFSKFGKVVSCELITDRFSGQSKGFAFIEMENDKEADEAISKLNGTQLGERKIVVNVARPREEKPRFSGRREDFRRNYREPRPNRRNF